MIIKICTPDKDLFKLRGYTHEIVSDKCNNLIHSLESKEFKYGSITFKQYKRCPTVLGAYYQELQAALFLPLKDRTRYHKWLIKTCAENIDSMIYDSRKDMLAIDRFVYKHWLLINNDQLYLLESLKDHLEKNYNGFVVIKENAQY